MKSTFKVTGAVIISIVATGLLVWFAIPHVRADDGGGGGKASVCGATPGCPEGVCCGQITSQTAGGCTAKGCCEGSDLYCSDSESRTPADFPKAAITGNGCCLVPGESLQVRCTERECGGTAYMCGSGTCNDTGDPLGTKKYAHPPQCRGVCPQQQE